MNDSFLANVDFDKVETLLESTDLNVKYFEDTCDALVVSYTSSLDEIMKSIYTDIISVESPSLISLEKYFLELTNALYFMGEKLENLGVYADMSKASMKEVYNNAYINYQTVDTNPKSKKTVAELTSMSESASQYETVVNNIYSRAYSIFKYKIESAERMVSTLSKIISRRMNEQSLSTMTDGTTRKVLMEEY